jgi:predicted nucleic acid-binding protein
MSHPKIVIDANLLKNISQGNVDAAEALLRYRRAGAEIYISRPAYEELVTRAPTPRFRAQYRTMLKELDIKIAPASAMKARVDLYADNIQTEPKASKGIGRFTEYGGKGNTEPGDVFVAGEAKSLNAQIFTLDETMVKRAKQFGVQLAPESTNIKAVRGPEDPTRGLDLLGIEEAEITITPMEINVSARAATAVGLEAGGMREAASTAAEVALTLGIQIGLFLIDYYMTKAIYNDIIKDGLKAAGKQAADRINKQLKQSIADLQLKLDDGEKVYANIVIQVHWIKYTLGAGRGDYIKPDVRLKDVNITSRNIKSERHFSDDPYEDDGSGNWRRYKREIDESIQSIEVAVYTKDEIEQFQDVEVEYLDYKRRLGMDPANVKLIEEERDLRQQIVKAYGPKVWFLDVR